VWSNYRSLLQNIVSFVGLFCKETYNLKEPTNPNCASCAVQRVLQSVLQYALQSVLQYDCSIPAKSLVHTHINITNSMRHTNIIKSKTLLSFTNSTSHWQIQKKIESFTYHNKKTELNKSHKCHLHSMSHLLTTNSMSRLYLWCDLLSHLKSRTQCVMSISRTRCHELNKSHKYHALRESSSYHQLNESPIFVMRYWVFEKSRTQCVMSISRTQYHELNESSTYHELSESSTYHELNEPSTYVMWCDVESFKNHELNASCQYHELNIKNSISRLHIWCDVESF